MSEREREKERNGKLNPTNYFHRLNNTPLREYVQMIIKHTNNKTITNKYFEIERFLRIVRSFVFPEGKTIKKFN